MDEDKPKDRATDDADLPLARRRFLLLALMRVAGVIFVLLGLMITTGATSLPNWLGWVVVAIGVTEAMLLPQVFARRWSSRRNP